MNRPDLLHETWKILLRAARDGTLESHSNSHSAVAHLVAARKGSHEGLTWSIPIKGYYQSICDLSEHSKLTPEEKLLLADGQREVRMTSYTLQELVQIEDAFEAPFMARLQKVVPGSNMSFHCHDPLLVIEGLTNVIDALQQIHECSDQMASDMRLQLAHLG